MARPGSEGWRFVDIAVTIALVAATLSACDAAVAFEKLTDMDYRGNTYYTIRNLTLYECQGWCREEPECQAASFSFVTNPLTPVQETVCLLQNETSANNPSALPKPAVSTYYMIKLRIRSDNVCNRPWTFERLPKKMLRGLDNALMFTSTKEACLAACLNERRFPCRSAEYSYMTLQCHLSEHDRRSVDETIEMVDADQVDYFENLCLTGDQACKGDREFPTPDIGVPNDVINRYVDTHYYVDLELMANNMEACRRACEIENEIMCRSFLYRGPPTGTTYNCQLFHLDHVTLPEGALTFLSSEQPLLDVGREPGVYHENVCKKPTDNMICRQVVTKNKRYITQIMCYEKPKSRQTGVFSFRAGSLDGGAPPAGGPEPGAGEPGPSGVGPTSAGDAAGGESDGGGTQVVTIPDLPTGGSGGAPGTPGAGGAGDGSPGGSSGGSPDGGSGATPGAVDNGTPGSASGGGDSTGGNGIDQSAGEGNDVNCDSTGTCYDVSVQCKDTRIVVLVGTNRPFNGRIYALGRSETCNVAVVNSDKFRLDLSLSGQDCNTQSMGTVYSNTVVVQHHSVVMTKTDKIYKVRCTYDMSSRNITFGMMPISQAAQDPNSEFYDPNFEAGPMGQLLIRDPDMISITSAPAAPPPKISILDSSGREVETVRIGDKLTFRIEIPPSSGVHEYRMGSSPPYGIFARNCVAMAKDAKSTFQIIDDQGCPIDPNIFPRFTSNINSLESTYEAFRFTESYGVIFQCNVKYCLGQCQPAQCSHNGKQFESWGRKKRALTPTMLVEDPRDPESMTLSQEILVLDFGDEPDARPQQQQRSSLPEVEVPPYVTHQTAFDSAGSDHFGFENDSVEVLEKCPTKTSVLALSVTCALLVLIYVCSMFYLFMKRWMTRNNKVL
ncbi:uncharacterized protein LOC119109045 [Pollicipes pollicipes]|uniref:uncharacterized protein LOC119109045 n=1 Tax=Pollicipes pollicipes TaxID=41117 RepID=UPI001885349A|nr:uncharacterized protein LOC119109045 [Pollicipes pollicipes]